MAFVRNVVVNKEGLDPAIKARHQEMKCVVDPRKTEVTVLWLDLDVTSFTFMDGHQDFINPHIIAQAEKCDFMMVVTHRCLLTIEKQMCREPARLEKLGLLEEIGKPELKEDGWTHQEYLLKINPPMKIWIIEKDGVRMIPQFFTGSLIKLLEEKTKRKCVAVSHPDDLVSEEPERCGSSHSFLVEYERSRFTKKKLLEEGRSLDEMERNQYAQNKNRQLLQSAQFVFAHCKLYFPNATQIKAVFIDDLKGNVEPTEDLRFMPDWPETVHLKSLHMNTKTNRLELVYDSMAEIDSESDLASLVAEMGGIFGGQDSDGSERDSESDEAVPQHPRTLADIEKDAKESFQALHPGQVIMVPQEVVDSFLERTSQAPEQKNLQPTPNPAAGSSRESTAALGQYHLHNQRETRQGLNLAAAGNPVRLDQKEKSTTINRCCGVA